MDFIKRLWGHHFVRETATLQVGSFVGTLFQAVAGVVIARLLQPEQYGVYALAFSMAGVMSIGLSSGVQEGMTTLLGEAYARRDATRIRELLAFFVKLSVLSGGLVLMVSLSLPFIAERFYDDIHIGKYAVIIVAASALSTLVYALVTMIVQVAGRIKWLALGNLIDPVIRYLLSVGLLFGGFGLAGAVSGHLLGAGIVAIIAIIAWRIVARRDALFPGPLAIAQVVPHTSLATHYRFSFWVALDRNLGLLYMVLPVVLTGLYVGVTQVAYFKLAFGYINIALSLLGPISVLLNVHFPRTHILEQGRLRHVFLRVSLGALGLSTVLTLAAVAVSPIAFRILYGETFLPSIPYVVGLTLYGALFGLGVGLGPMWRTLNQVKTSIIINAVILIIGIPLGIVLLKSFGIWGAVMLVTGWFTVAHTTSFFFALRSC